MKKNTRELLLDSAFKAFYKNGYQGANISSILNEVGINKGSMYHYFKSKKELSLAVLKERIQKNLIHKYKEVLTSKNIFNMLFETLINSPQTLIYGCPLNKMSQEMIYLDNDFKQTLSLVYNDFENIIENILLKAIDNKEIKNLQAKQNAQLIIATYEGALMIYHLNQDKKQYTQILQNLKLSFLL